MVQRSKPTLPQRILFGAGKLIFLTLLFAALGMGIGLFIGILTAAFTGGLHHGAPGMAAAYRKMAVPTAIVFGTCALLFQIFTGIRTALRPRS